MQKKTILLKVVLIVAAVMCALGARAQEAYACYTPDNRTLTFYYDRYRSSRIGTTYDLNTDMTETAWETDGINASVLKVVFNSSFYSTRPTTTFKWFHGMNNLETIKDLRHLVTSKVTNMTGMFSGCHKLTSLDLTSFNTANVTSMRSMFEDCYSLQDIDLSCLNISSVIDMSHMFSGCAALTSLDMSRWNTSKVNDMGYMFADCSNLRSVYVGNGWSTAAVANSTNMFRGCTSMVGGQGTTYDANHVDAAYAHIDGGPSNPGYFIARAEAYACYTESNTTLTFYCDNERGSRTGTTYELNTNHYDPGWILDEAVYNATRVVFDPSFADARPTTTHYWFFAMSNLESITGMKEYLNTSEVTRMYRMFAYCSQLTSIDLSGFNTSKVTQMDFMFYECSNLTSIDLSGWNTSNVTIMDGLFYGCSNLTSLDLSSFNTANVQTMMAMFAGCTNLQTIYVGNDWSTAALTESSEMFYNCISLVGGQGTTFDASHVDAAYAHVDGGPGNLGYFTKASEAYACYTPSNTALTFYYDNQRSTRTGTTYDLPIENSIPAWHDGETNVAITQAVFDASFADARPTTTNYWFNDMTVLKNITGIEYFNTSEVTSMKSMFNACYALTGVDVSNFNTEK